MYWSLSIKKINNNVLGEIIPAYPYELHKPHKGTQDPVAARS